MGKNKVRYGLKNVHTAIVTETTQSGVTTSAYGTPVPFPGAISLNVNEASGDNSVFRADDMDYFIVQGSSQGFDGDFECAEIPEAFETDVLGARKDDNGVICDYANDEIKYVALLFEIDGDNSGRRYCVPKALFNKPGISAETTGTDGNQPKTKTLNFKASPRPDDNLARFHTGDTTGTATYNSWFDSVYTPSFTNSQNAQGDQNDQGEE